MGFRSLKDFYLALLNKQDIKKAKYFNGSDIQGSLVCIWVVFYCKVNNNPRFVWISIWGAQSIVKVGVRVRWRPGSGSSISVLGEPWLPQNMEPFVPQRHQFWFRRK